LFVEIVVVVQAVLCSVNVDVLFVAAVVMLLRTGGRSALFVLPSLIIF